MKNVISLFDGMGIGLLSLLLSGKKNFNYYRVENDKKVNNAFFKFFTEEMLAKANVNVIHHDDVRTFPPKECDGPTTYWETLFEYGAYLLMGGSPCTNLSFAGKQEGLEGEQSSLFYEFVRIKNLYKPTWFLLENTPMKKEYENIISKELGVEPVRIDSADFSAQSRKRLYWTNIHFHRTWNKSPLVTEDILEEKVEDKYFIEPKRAVVICDNECKKHKIAYIGDDRSANRVYHIHGKSVTLIANGGGLGAKTGLYAFPCLSADRLEKRQNGRRFKPPRSKFYTLTTIDRHGVLIGNNIRKLTPTECERLQGWPKDITLGAGSDSERYRICGNGWTEPVIRHILSGVWMKSFILRKKRKKLWWRTIQKRLQN